MAYAARLIPPVPGTGDGPGSGDRPIRDWISPTAPIPFEDLLIGSVDAAIPLLGQAAEGALGMLSQHARATLCRALLVRLSDIALATFASEFALHRALHAPLPGTVSTADHAYRHFVAAQATTPETMAQYPALAALLRDTCRNWAEAHGELLSRLNADWPEIRRACGAAGPRPGIASIAPYRSDPHHGGRAVTLLGLECGQVLLYKPRSMAMEQRLDALLGWANGHGYAHPFRRPALVVRESHGWMEHVAAVPCRTAAEVAAYYHRIGGLICLVTLFQGTDIHQENLIAAGEHPVIVDAETLVHPRLRPDFAEALGPGAARHPPATDFAETLDDCGFLPRRHGVDFSALGAVDAVDTPFPQPRCTGINSDAMRVEQVPYQASRRDNVPTLHGAAQHACDHVAPVLAGYAEMFAVALRHRASLVDLADSFAGHRTRLIVRSTNAYGLLLNASCAPPMLRDGAARRALFGRLAAAASHAPCAGASTGILAEELHALLRHDVPHLTRPCDATGPGWPSPLGQVRRRIAALAPDALGGNLALLRERLGRITPPASTRDNG